MLCAGGMGGANPCKVLGCIGIGDASGDSSGSGDENPGTVVGDMAAPCVAAGSGANGA